MFKPYRTILSLPGTLTFATLGWVARLPISMVGLGFVLLVSARTGSYAVAGSVSAAYVLAAAAVAPIQARLADRVGQHRVIALFSIVYTLAIGGTVIVVEIGTSTPVPQILAGLAGAASPQIGSYIRARWSHLLEGKPELQTAFALEALLDEVVFMVGPPLVTLLATAISPVVGLGTAMTCGLIGSLLLAAHRRSEPPAHGRDGATSRKQPLGWGTLAPVIFACIGLGVLFGGTEVIVVAFATEQNARPISGVLLAIWAAGSMLAALILGAMTLRKPAITRFRIGAVAMGLAMLPLPFVGSLGVLGAVLFVAGFAISPTLIAGIAVVQATVPSSRLSEGMSWVTSGLVAGVALGAAAAGQVIDRSGASTAFFVSVAAGLLAAAASFVGGGRARGSSGGTTTDLRHVGDVTSSAK